MVKVLVLGASGAIGLPIAQALSRAGHQVIGLTRSEAKAKTLAAEEITPVIGEPDSDSWLPHVATLDAVIDAVGGTANIQILSKTIYDAVGQAAKKYRPDHAPRLNFIYTSGTWVHGENRKEIVTDSSPLTNPAEIVTWRVDHEQRVVHGTDLNGIVVRPSLVYGRGGSLLAGLFESASKGKVVWPGTPGGRFALIHPDDLADLYLKVVEKAPLLGGKIFDASNDFTESVDDFLETLVRVSGAQGPYEYREPANAFERAMGSTSLIRPYLARALLDWQPRKAGLVDGLPTYYAAWRASRI